MLSSVPVRPCDFRSVGPSPSAFPLDVVGAEPEIWESVVLLRPSLNVPAFPSAGKLGEASSYLRTDLLCFPPVSLVLREGVMGFRGSAQLQGFPSQSFVSWIVYHTYLRASLALAGSFSLQFK